jgi:prepilin-type N-terminal cleavage/methylation domain-containing protein
MKEYRQMKKKEGFTLIETLVAITILLVAIVGPIQTVSQATALGVRSRDELIASYLAQDAVEYMRYKIVTNGNDEAVDIINRDLLGAPTNLGVCKSPNICSVNTKEDTFDLCVAGVCPVLQWANTGVYYGYGEGGGSPTWGPTDFKREVMVTEGIANTDLGNEKEYFITSTVYWGKNYENHLQISENVVDWRIIFHSDD